MRVGWRMGRMRACTKLVPGSIFTVVDESFLSNSFIVEEKLLWTYSEWINKFTLEDDSCGMSRAHRLAGIISWIPVSTVICPVVFNSVGWQDRSGCEFRNRGWRTESFIPSYLRTPVSWKPNSYQQIWTVFSTAIIFAHDERRENSLLHQYNGDKY